MQGVELYEQSWPRRGGYLLTAESAWRDGCGFAPAQLLDHVQHVLLGQDANVAQDAPICHFIGYDWGGCSAPEQN